MPGSSGGSAAGPASRAAEADDSAALTVALVGPTSAGTGPGSTSHRLVGHTLALADQLSMAGHDVTLLSWSPGTTHPDGRATTGPAEDTLPRTWRTLSRSRPDTWARTGRRLRGYDTVLVVHTGPAMVPLHLALLHAAGAGQAGGPTGPSSVLLVDELLPARPHAGVHGLLAALLRRVDGVLVHRAEQAPLATRLGATRVYAVAQPDLVTPRVVRPAPDLAAAFVTSARRSLAAGHGPAVAGGSGGARQPDRRVQDGPTDRTAHDLDEETSAAWARYVGAIEALSAPCVPASDVTHATTPDAPPDADQRLAGDDPRLSYVRRRWSSLASSTLVTTVTRVRATSPDRRLRGRRVKLDRSDLPGWILLTDVLEDAAQADEAGAEAARLGLRRHRDGIAAWAALGALAAIVRVADDGRRSAVVVDESGSRSPLSAWARAVGFAPVDLGVTVQPGLRREPDLLELDAGGVDVVVRIHPGGCDASDLDETLSQSSWVLRPGGLLILTVPLGAPGIELALGPADVRAVVARADELGFVLVGDLDGEIGRRMRRAAADAGATGLRSPGAAYGLVRLTLRRR